MDTHRPVAVDNSCDGTRTGCQCDLSHQVLALQFQQLSHPGNPRPIRRPYARAAIESCSGKFAPGQLTQLAVPYSSPAQPLAAVQPSHYVNQIASTANVHPAMHQHGQFSLAAYEPAGYLQSDQIASTGNIYTQQQYHAQSAHAGSGYIQAVYPAPQNGTSGYAAAVAFMHAVQSQSTASSSSQPGYAAHAGYMQHMQALPQQASNQSHAQLAGHHAAAVPAQAEAQAASAAPHLFAGSMPNQAVQSVYSSQQGSVQTEQQVAVHSPTQGAAAVQGPVVSGKDLHRAVLSSPAAASHSSQGTYIAACCIQQPPSALFCFRPETYVAACYLTIPNCFVSF